MSVSRIVSARLPEDLYRTLLEVASRNKVTVSDVVRNAIREYLSKS